MSDMNEEMQILFDNYTALMDGGQYLQLKQELNEEQPANIAEYFEELTAEKQLFIFRLLSKDVAAEVFSYMDNCAVHYRPRGAQYRGRNVSG